MDTASKRGAQRIAATRATAPKMAQIWRARSRKHIRIGSRSSQQRMEQRPRAWNSHTQRVELMPGGRAQPVPPLRRARVGARQTSESVVRVTQTQDAARKRRAARGRGGGLRHHRAIASKEPQVDGM